MNSSVDHCAVKNNSHTDMNILLILYIRLIFVNTETYQNCTPEEQLMSVSLLYYNHIIIYFNPLVSHRDHGLVLIFDYNIMM